ncbi:MAG TPA: hypothetical protein VKH37_03780 [Ferruginibacter sp.]|nr:hypothetical protein [Ferruginibacter sp.]
MEATNVQVLFFQHIKNSLPPHLSLVDEVAERLNISNDSAYRRIRGEKAIAFEELQILCSHYEISLDQFLHLKSDAFIFSGKLKDDGNNVFENYLEEVLKNFTYFNSFKSKHLYWLMKDIPPFAHYQIPELACFKFYFWMKSILHDERLRTVKFALDDERYQPYIAVSNKVVDLYHKIPVTEIWNIESLNSSLRQINFFREAGSFKNPSEAGLLYDKLEELINHFEKQAEVGVKFRIGSEPNSSSPSYRMFVNELILGDNTILAELDGARLTFLNHSVLYFVATADERFNRAMFTNLDNLMKKSTMISSVGEKERSGFFNQLRDKIGQYRAMLK